jgi:hypothetical protein
MRRRWIVYTATSRAAKFGMAVTIEDANYGSKSLELLSPFDLNKSSYRIDLKFVSQCLSWSIRVVLNSDKNRN